MPVEISRLDAEQALLQLDSLCNLFQDAVDGGASLGYWAPLSKEAATEYWQGVVGSVKSGQKILLVAGEADLLSGSVQLELSNRQNGAQRAELQKLMVHRQARRQGLGLALIRAAEECARQAQRSLIFLDTRQGDEAEQLYRKAGYSFAGVIPAYVLESDGSLSGTCLYYRQI